MAHGAAMCNDFAEVDRKIELYCGRFAFKLKDNQRMSHVQCVRKEKKKQTLQKLLLVLSIMLPLPVPLWADARRTTVNFVCEMKYEFGICFYLRMKQESRSRVSRFA